MEELQKLMKRLVNKKAELYELAKTEGSELQKARLIAKASGVGLAIEEVRQMIKQYEQFEESTL